MFALAGTTTILTAMCLWCRFDSDRTLRQYAGRANALSAQVVKTGEQETVDVSFLADDHMTNGSAPGDQELAARLMTGAEVVRYDVGEPQSVFLGSSKLRQRSANLGAIALIPATCLIVCIGICIYCDARLGLLSFRTVR